MLMFSNKQTNNDHFFSYLGKDRVVHRAMRDKGPTEKQRGWHNKSLATATPKNNGRLVDTRAVTPRSNLNSGGKVDDTGKNPKQVTANLHENSGKKIHPPRSQHFSFGCS